MTIRAKRHEVVRVVCEFWGLASWDDVIDFHYFYFSKTAYLAGVVIPNECLRFPVSPASAVPVMIDWPFAA